MDWKSEAREKLTDYELKRNAVKSIREELRRLNLEHSVLQSTRTDSIPIHGGDVRREDALLTNIVRRGELEKRLQIVEVDVRQVERAFGVLGEEDRVLLRRMYMTGERGAVSKLMEEKGLEKSVLYKKRDRALRAFTVALYGTE